MEKYIIWSMLRLGGFSRRYAKALVKEAERNRKILMIMQMVEVTEEKLVGYIEEFANSTGISFDVALDYILYRAQQEMAVTFSKKVTFPNTD